MMERGKISGLQMAILLYPTIIATAILLVPAISGKFAEQDMWLSPIWASLAGFLTVYIALLLHNHYPELTIMQYSGKIIGFIPGKIVGLGLLFYLLHTNGVVLREYGEFVVGNFLPSTPIIVITGSMAFVCALSVRGGLEVMARSAQIFIPVFMTLFLVIILLLFPELRPANIFPVMDDGITPSIKGAIVPSQWFTEFFLIIFMLPYLRTKEKRMTWGMLSVVAVMITLVITNLFSLLLFGDITSKFTYPVMSAARYIDVADFLQHVESIVMAIWVVGVFIKVSVFYYAIVIGTAQWLHLSDYRPIVFPIGLLLIIFSTWVAASLQELSHFLSTVWPFYALVFQLVLPVLLLLVAMMRKKAAENDN
ncbi:germination protein [Lentibacillus kapialis]|uniref:Germination protein n=1 Tax=Lentibacillus kapialis TaxID=340214 RepID=A0A917PYC2_9BACI|nr:endospore germination permease [Lentibacillus kapialis]GGJ99367.1 germination protein [Lentibacillus kapialis]